MSAGRPDNMSAMRQRRLQVFNELQSRVGLNAVALLLQCRGHRVSGWSRSRSAAAGACFWRQSVSNNSVISSTNKTYPVAETTYRPRYKTSLFFFLSSRQPEHSSFYC